MDYRCWEDGQGYSPVLVAMRDIKSKDPRSGRSIEKHLQKLQKYSYSELAKHRIIKKLKGKNPLKLHEFRLSLPKKIARIFFVVQNNVALLLHMIVKKSDDTPLKDIEVAEARALDT